MRVPMKGIIYLVCMVVLVPAGFAQSQPLRLAVAANAQFVIKAIQLDFKKKTGIETEAIIGSSGNLSTQIKNGAPYDIFFSADMNFPDKLASEGFGVTAATEYASGSLIVCSTTNIDIRNWRLLLAAAGTKKIAIANPALAPYGKAAEEALRHYKLWDKINSRLVFGESISQVNTYITTGAAMLGFTTEALIHEYPDKKNLRWAKVDETVYNKIRQGMIVLSHSKKGNYTSAMKFYDYILSPAAKQVFRQFGYK